QRTARADPHEGVQPGRVRAGQADVVGSFAKLDAKGGHSINPVGRGLHQGGGFVEAVHPVEVLDRDPAGAANEVVQAGEDDDAVAHDADGQVEEVRVDRVLGRRQVRDDADE